MSHYICFWNAFGMSISIFPERPPFPYLYRLQANLITARYVESTSFHALVSAATSPSTQRLLSNSFRRTADSSSSYLECGNQLEWSSHPQSLMAQLRNIDVMLVFRLAMLSTPVRHAARYLAIWVGDMR